MNNELRNLKDSELHSLQSAIMDELIRRAVDRSDPDVIAHEAMQSMFSSSGDPRAPMIIGGLVVAAGSVQDTSAGKHVCKLFTVKIPDGSGEFWSWEEGGSSFVHGESDKVGKVRRSVNLHVPVDGMMLIQHSMRHDGERHTRNSCRAWEVKLDVDMDTGEILSRIEMRPDWTPGHLPPPHGEIDRRSYIGKSG